MIKMRTVTLALALAGVAALAVFAATAAIAIEIKPSPKMVSDAKKLNTDDISGGYEYYFRSIGGHVLWCAYYSGGNGNYCTKVNHSYIEHADRAAVDYCKTADDGDDAPHVVYGELYDLNYTCEHHRMTRLPVQIAVDSEGYVRSQWKVLTQTQ